MFQIRSWQLALSLLGFFRIYVEKLKHLRCLAFVKVDKKFDKVCRDEAEMLSRKLGFDQNLGFDEKIISDPTRFQL